MFVFTSPLFVYVSFWRGSMEKYTQLKVVGEGSFGRAVLVQWISTQEKYVVKEIQLPKVRTKKSPWKIWKNWDF